MKLWHWIGLFLAVIWVGSSFPQNATKRPAALTRGTNAPENTPTNKPSTIVLQGERAFLYVTGSVVNVRSGPGTSYRRVAQLKRSNGAHELSRSNGWVQISFAGGSGWMFGKYLSKSPPKAPTPAPVSAPAVRHPTSQRQCHPNYSGGCVPIASDVDCAGGSGNGPAYVRGPVRVIGADVYRLDRDKNGIGCE